MKKTITTTLLTLLTFQFAKADTPNYSTVYEVKSERAGGELVRHIKRFDDDCFDIEILSAKQKWKVTSTLNLCSFEGKSFSNGFADVEFKDISFKADGLHFNLSTTPLEPIGEQIRECLIPISNNKLGKLQCSDVRTPE
ncbi:MULTISPECIES: hypothetical protein [unclassified Pseudomonas]|uniref:hypothetical protein n=1 Tax=unclassified Pseudomonas TaxID=196821 RepID=UPI0011143F0C|nr:MULTISPECIES: hypothetical protein [unclassified Pseudomonas]